MTEWVPEVGDKAVILSSNARNVTTRYREVTIERFTKTQIITSGEGRFRRTPYQEGVYREVADRGVWGTPDVLVAHDSSRAAKARVSMAAARIRAVTAKASLTSIASVDDLAAMLAEQRRLIEQSQQR